MIIKQKVTEVRKVEREIDLPYYCRSKHSVLCVYGPENEQAVEVFVIDNYACIATKGEHEVARLVGEYSKCSEQEFLQAYNIATDILAKAIEVYQPVLMPERSGEGC